MQFTAPTLFQHRCNYALICIIASNKRKEKKSTVCSTTRWKQTPQGGPRINSWASVGPTHLWPGRPTVATSLQHWAVSSKLCPSLRRVLSKDQIAPTSQVPQQNAYPKLRRKPSHFFARLPQVPQQNAYPKLTRKPWHFFCPKFVNRMLLPNWRGSPGIFFSKLPSFTSERLYPKLNWKPW
jgi:hypothetical protein